MSHQQSEIQQEPLISTTTYKHTTVLVMAGFKSLVHQTSKAAVLVLVITLMVQSQSSRAQSQSCSSELSSLNVCGPFVVPGNSANPSTECCGALQGVQHDCLCSTLRIASQLPSRCNIPPASCDTA